MTQPAAWRRMTALLREVRPFMVTIWSQKAKGKTKKKDFLIPN
jgi:hypothetical protein